MYEGYWKNGVFEGKGRFIGYQPEEKRTFVLDGYWYEEGTKFKGKVTVDDRVIEDVTMLFNLEI